MITCKNLSKKFGDVIALSNISFSIDRKKLAIFGRNGSGKTTLAKIIAGIIKPTSGEVKVLGKDPRDPKTKKKIGFASHNPMLYKDLTVRENLEFYARLYDAEIVKAVKFLSLEEKLEKKVSELSRGFIQRVSIARAILQDPEILILDEAFSALDIDAKRRLMNFLEKFEKTLVFITHQPEEAKFCDFFAVLKDGTISYFGDSYEEAISLI